MNFIMLYERVSEERDKNTPGTQLYTNKLAVYEKLLNIAFENNDELPEKFYIFKVHLSKNELENILDKIQIEANVNVINESYDTGNIFEITLK